MTPRPILKTQPTHSLSCGPSCSSNAGSEDMYDADLFAASSHALPFASSSRLPPLDSPHVHFPSTPSLTQMVMTHSSYSYDRKSIKVLPNNLALPERDAREVGDDARVVEASPRWTPSAKGDRGYFYPRAYDEDTMDMDPEPSTSSSSQLSGASNTGRNSAWSYPPFCHQIGTYNHSDLIPPPLVFDQSSESDSDMCSPGSPAGVRPSSLPRISVHFSGISMGPPSPSSILTRKRIEGEDVDLGFGKKQKSRKRYDVPLSTDLTQCGGLNAAQEPSTYLADAFNRTQSRTRHIANDSALTRSSSMLGCSSFYEGGLEGCLGGF